jgi:hypothetical protein
VVTATASTLDFAGYCSDPDGDPLVYVRKSDPAHGTVTAGPSQTLSYTSAVRLHRRRQLHVRRARRPRRGVAGRDPLPRRRREPRAELHGPTRRSRCARARPAASASTARTRTPGRSPTRS